MAGGFPLLSCIDTIADSLGFREVAAIAPEGMRRRPQPQDDGWLPTRLADLAVRRGFIAVIDGGAAELTLFLDDQFRERRTLATRGPGPAELVDPVAVAFDASGDTIWVLDQRPSRLVAFTPEGGFARTIRVDAPSADLAITESGHFVLAHSVVHVAPHGTDGSVVLVSTLNRTTERRAPLIVVPRDSIVPPRFVLPGFTEVRLGYGSDRLAVFFPASGVVDLVNEAGEVTRRVRVCVPGALDEAYTKQRARVGQASQLSVNLISDVLIRDGIVYAMGSRPADAGQYHMDRFALGGQNLGSFALYEPRIRMPDEVRLVNSDTFLAFNSVSGGIARFAVRRAVPAE